MLQPICRLLLLPHKQLQPSQPSPNKKKSKTLEQVRVTMTHNRNSDYNGLEARYTSLQNERDLILFKIENTPLASEKAKHRSHLMSHENWMKRVEDQLEEARIRVDIWTKVESLVKEKSEPKMEISTVIGTEGIPKKKWKNRRLIWKGSQKRKNRK